MTPERLEAIVGQFSSRRVAVVGDFFLDKYLDVDPALVETSVETGKRAHQVIAARCSPGAAGTVVANLAALGAGRIAAIGAIGEDGEASELRRGLERLGCDTSRLLSSPRLLTPTYLKPRDVTQRGLAGEHERYDTKNRRATPAEIEDHVLAALEALLRELDAVVVADQVQEEDCGVITGRVRDRLAEIAKRHSRVVFWADSRRRIDRFRNVMIKPNQHEAMGHRRDAGAAPSVTDDSVPLDALHGAIGYLRKLVGAPVCITRGPAGALVSDPVVTEVPGVAVHGPTDPTGAGDSFSAAAVLALAAAATLPEAALVGNLAASITVQQLGTTGTARREQLLERLELTLKQR